MTELRAPAFSMPVFVFVQVFEGVEPVGVVGVTPLCFVSDGAEGEPSRVLFLLDWRGDEEGVFALDGIVSMMLAEVGVGAQELVERVSQQTGYTLKIVTIDESESGFACRPERVPTFCAEQYIGQEHTRVGVLHFFPWLEICYGGTAQDFHFHLPLASQQDNRDGRVASGGAYAFSIPLSLRSQMFWKGDFLCFLDLIPLCLVADGAEEKPSRVLYLLNWHSDESVGLRRSRGLMDVKVADDGVAAQELVEQIAQSAGFEVKHIDAGDRHAFTRVLQNLEIFRADRQARQKHVLVGEHQQFPGVQICFGGRSLDDFHLHPQACSHGGVGRNG